MAYSFNGTNQYLKTDSAVISTVPATLAAWCYPLDAADGRTVLRVGVWDNVSRIALIARGNVAGNPIRVIHNRAGTQGLVDTTAAFSTTAWNHACAAYSSQSSRSALLNGANKATETTDVGSPDSGWNSIALGTQITSGSLFQPMNGLIAEAAIWNVALTDAEIASLATGFKPTRIRPQSLVFYAPLIRDLQDTRGGLTITNNNSATVADHPRVY